jgi:hypothetical protein
MNISAVMDGESVNIVDIDVNGHQVYVSYVVSGNLLVKRQFFYVEPGSTFYTLASAASIIS